MGIGKFLKLKVPNPLLNLFLHLIFDKVCMLLVKSELQKLKTYDYVYSLVSCCQMFYLIRINYL